MAQPRKDRGGFYVQEDYWNAIAHLPKAQQDKAIGSLVRLFFTGTDDPPKAGAARTMYFSARDRVNLARNKARNASDTIFNIVGNGQAKSKNTPENPLATCQQNDSKLTADSDFASKEGEGEFLEDKATVSVDLSTGGIQPATIPQVETNVETSESAAFVADALRIFSEETGRTCLIPPPIVHGYLLQIRDAGYTLDDVRAVCADRDREWRDDPHQQQFIRPQTLFEPGKFEGYANSAKNSKAVKIDEEAARYANAL